GSKYGSPSLHSSHSLVSLTGDRVCEMKRRRLRTRPVSVKSSSLHSTHSLDERTCRMKRRILHFDSPNRTWFSGLMLLRGI
ncbi:hypothetical protein PENTCL1PPCAC_4324, partial [Pristionchus entomophagus]